MEYQQKVLISVKVPKLLRNEVRKVGRDLGLTHASSERVNMTKTVIYLLRLGLALATKEGKELGQLLIKTLDEVLIKTLDEDELDALAAEITILQERTRK